ncbi:hypothetical protein [Marinobacter zhanjiangensis]|uniref:Uncharacterized protein n=1 Tax=Marinobacter zhanjiangensis TaxID=578215 RepID=A0ABQ3APH5_9GAMM|nr:hypothetical protein [Marinobacter zhanjiangensis]GGY62671.1 hypothetical protein GCM10007071_07000 [Marinobacter zhanjiangensis]
MIRKDPVLVQDIFNQVYELTRWPRHGAESGAEAFPHDRAYAVETLRRIARNSRQDPFNYALYDAWQLVHQKPWTRPPNLNLLVNDLADAIHRGWLFAYTEASGISRSVR